MRHNFTLIAWTNIIMDQYKFFSWRFGFLLLCSSTGAPSTWLPGKGMTSGSARRRRLNKKVWIGDLTSAEIIVKWNFLLRHFCCFHRGCLNLFCTNCIIKMKFSRVGMKFSLRILFKFGIFNNSSLHYDQTNKCKYKHMQQLKLKQPWSYDHMSVCTNVPWHPCNWNSSQYFG